MNKISYEGKKVSIGIDVHKNQYTVTCVCEGMVVQRATMRAEPEKLAEFIKMRFAGAQVRSAYEAGFSGFVLHRVLEKAGVENLVVHAASIEIASRDRVKTDRRDSLKIAEQLHCGRLRSIMVPSEAEEAKRLLHRTREQLLRERTRIVNQVKMRLYQFGIAVPRTVNSKSLQELLKKRELRQELRVALEALIGLWGAVQGEIKKIEEHQKVQAKQDPCTAVYTSLPGIGFQGARVLSNEVGTLEQFSNERAVFSFVGLSPTERSSGETERRGHISRQGSARLRCILVESAWTAVRYDQYWRSQYRRLASRIGGKRAIVAIARRLIGVARALFRKGELYTQPEVKAAA